MPGEERLDHERVKSDGSRPSLTKSPTAMECSVSPISGHDSTSAPCMMAAFPTFANLAPKTKNLIVAGGLSAFVFGVYFYTMKAVGGTDELQVAINKFEEEKHKQQDQPGSQAA